MATVKATRRSPRKVTQARKPKNDPPPVSVESEVVESDEEEDKVAIAIHQGFQLGKEVVAKGESFAWAVYAFASFVYALKKGSRNE